MRNNVIVRYTTGYATAASPSPGLSSALVFVFWAFVCDLPFHTHRNMTDHILLFLSPTLLASGIPTGGPQGLSHASYRRTSTLEPTAELM